MTTEKTGGLMSLQSIQGMLIFAAIGCITVTYFVFTGNTYGLICSLCTYLTGICIFAGAAVMERGFRARMHSLLEAYGMQSAENTELRMAADRLIEANKAIEEHVGVTDELIKANDVEIANLKNMTASIQERCDDIVNRSYAIKDSDMLYWRDFSGACYRQVATATDTLSGVECIVYCDPRTGKTQICPKGHFLGKMTQSELKAATGKGAKPGTKMPYRYTKISEEEYNDYISFPQDAEEHKD